jgi:hypothetical protein
LKTVDVTWLADPITDIVKESTRGVMKKKWSFDATVEGVSKGAWWFGCGFWIADHLGVVVPYLWRTGGRAWEEKVLRVLGTRAHSRAGGGLVSDSGSVALARIPILPENLDGFEVDRDRLAEAVVQAFTAIGTKDLEAMLDDGTREPEEKEESAAHLSEAVLADLRRRWVACEPASVLAREAGMSVAGLQKALGFGESRRPG